MHHHTRASLHILHFRCLEVFIIQNLNVLVYIHSVCRFSIELKPKIFKINLEKSQTEKDQKQEDWDFKIEKNEEI